VNLRTRKIEDEHGKWIYEYYGTWRYANIISIKRVDKFTSANKEKISE
jgi:hypothetical protein